MVELNFQRLAPAVPVATTRARRPLGTCLLDRGLITQDQLIKALHLQRRQNAPLGEILVGEGWASRQDVMAALSDQSGLQIADFTQHPPEADLCATMPIAFWLEHNVIPWRRTGPLLLVATARPDRFETIVRALRAFGHTAVPVLAGPDQIDTALGQVFARPLAQAAETRVEPAQSCRTWTASSRAGPVALLIGFCALGVAMPYAGLALLFWMTVLTLLLFMVLRISGLIAYLLPQPEAPEGPKRGIERQPCVSILVPLFKEKEIADALIARLHRLTYPKALLDVILVLEERDDVTRATLENVSLPSWIRVLEVPEHGDLTTKPRAMNYALDFCRGEILGVWDAEDAPLPDQIETVTRHFAQAPNDVVCLQGVLDYYNPRTNWRSRCFTIEYSGWFRVVLPGIARLGLVVPLGGTTFFFRRDKLLELGGWDAHNVTEDADLGVRLSRAGYRTEMVNTTTYEEANFRAWPWVKQRSRWLKGFMVTYLVHMRAPRRLLRELGMLRFLGVQAFFLGTVGQFLLAPVLWLFWLATLGLGHPYQAVIPGPVLSACVFLFLLAEAANFVVGALGVAAGNRRYLIPWVPTMALYYPLGVLAAYKGLWELAVKPFFWDKTQHGHAQEETPEAPISRAVPHPVSVGS
ncbi:glycosyltransferase family 2 protein [Ruegeria sp.]|uniref:glycosyltransferase family 2 protein n=1 Tax=Ruegeria sp. TaxID=1879320 RepID=UPI0023257A56|nr:glycosyltransferase family 2 protein [Ruegeria sp.]MDA7965913.1 glycosyltransferase [Ruegeria sp.]